ncbi:MAG TPA: hypothetical protein VEF04_23445 [Blastocatellia bacterium]|nr:hypothetical protein [Blastocatellia bacterium]
MSQLVIELDVVAGNTLREQLAFAAWLGFRAKYSRSKAEQKMCREGAQRAIEWINSEFGFGQYLTEEQRKQVWPNNERAEQL